MLNLAVFRLLGCLILNIMQTEDEIYHDQRNLCIKSALELASDGGYEAVRMRHVAESAGVAVGTVYLYFSSKDHLLVTAMTKWANDLHADVLRRPPQASSAKEHIMSVFRRALRAIEQNEKLLPTFVKARQSGGKETNAEREAGQEVFLRALLGPYSLDNQELVTRVLLRVWQGSLFDLAFNATTTSEVLKDLEAVVRLLLDGPLPQE